MLAERETVCLAAVVFSLFVRPTLEHFLEPFYHMPNDMKMIDDNLRLGQAELDRWAIRCTHIHTHGLDGIRITEPFEPCYNLLLFASSAHFQHLTSFQIAEDRVIAVSFATSKLINTQKMRGVQRQVLIYTQSFVFDCLEGNGLKALLHKAWANSGGLGHMRDRLGAGLLADLFSQAHGRLPSPATRLVLFRKGFATAQAAKAAFQHDQFDWMPPQGSISFLSGSRIMDFDAPCLTMRAGCLGRCCHHLHPDRSIGEPFLAHNMQLVEVSWHQNCFAGGSLFCDMLAWQGLSSVI